MTTAAPNEMPSESELKPEGEVVVVSVDALAEVYAFPEPPGGEVVVESADSYDYPYIDRDEDQLKRLEKAIADVLDEASRDPEAFWGPIEEFARKAAEEVAVEDAGPGSASEGSAQSWHALEMRSSRRRAAWFGKVATRVVRGQTGDDKELGAGEAEQHPR